jgi:replication-associated recombination protein RarA
MNKRKLGHHSDSDENIFDITSYKLDTLENLIEMISDYSNKKLPKRKQRRFYPDKMNVLPNILEDLKDLDNMIGLKKLKTQLIDQILYFIQGIDETVMLHTVLEGPPGTGKTSVSHILAKIYSKLGIFKKVKFNIARRADLISEYLGGTTIKTLETLNKCKNGVVLIDEAYSLGSNSGQEDMYAKECVDTLNQYLTENVDKIICIIAGYKKELDSCFFSLNPGLRRRFPWTFTIENYTPSELTEIYFKCLDAKEWETSCKKEEIQELIARNILLFSGNGGDINNIIEKAIFINSRNNFGKENLFTISLQEFKDALDIFIENKQGKQNYPPYGMYN